MTGPFSSYFRTGNSQGSTVEAILQSLNDARGTAYSVEPGTAVYAENYALARALSDAWETSQRFQNQFNPAELTVFLDRWEAILGIVPDVNANDNTRRNAVAAKWLLFNLVPTAQACIDLLNTLIPTVFVAVIHNTSATALSLTPGGATVPGGSVLGDGSYASSIAAIMVRVVQPPSMSDAEFYQTVNAFKPFFDDFMPAYVTFDWGRYGVDLGGQITLSALDTVVSGTGTSFVTGINPMEVGEEIEVYDDTGTLRTLTVSAVTNNTQLIIQSPIPARITLAAFKRFGFFLDTINLDNSFLSST